MLSTTRSLKDKGETIVEVLIVMMVLGSVLTGAFVITGKATSQDQSSQERSEASAYGLSQIERLKSLLGSNTGVSPTGNFCLDATNQPVAVIDATVGGCKETIHNRYAGYLVFDTMTQTYIETVIWAGLSSGSVDRITLVYKVSNG